MSEAIGKVRIFNTGVGKKGYFYVRIMNDYEQYFSLGDIVSIKKIHTPKNNKEETKKPVDNTNLLFKKFRRFD